MKFAVLDVHRIIKSCSRRKERTMSTDDDSSEDPFSSALRNSAYSGVLTQNAQLKAELHDVQRENTDLKLELHKGN